METSGSTLGIWKSTAVTLAHALFPHCPTQPFRPTPCSGRLRQPWTSRKVLLGATEAARSRERRVTTSEDVVGGSASSGGSAPRRTPTGGGMKRVSGRAESGVGTPRRGAAGRFAVRRLCVRSYLQRMLSKESGDKGGGLTRARGCADRFVPLGVTTFSLPVSAPAANGLAAGSARARAGSDSSGV